MNSHNQHTTTTKLSHGFGIVEILVILAVIAIIGLISYRLLSTDQNTQQAESSQTTNEDTPTISTSEDLDTAASALESEDIDGDSQQQLSEQTDF